MWQPILVGVIVTAALLHFCSKYLPAAWRRQIVHALSQRGFDQACLARLFNTESSCGDGCSSCGSCDDAPQPAVQASEGVARRVIRLHVQR
jgi:hypothetical protein